MSYLFPSATITFEAALRDLASGSPKARAFAAHALGDITDPVEKRRAVDALVRALDDDRPEVRAEACASLGELGEPGSLALLIKRLGDGAPAVRQNAAIALGTLRLAEAFEPLADALRDGPVDLRFQAATSLAEIDPMRAFDCVIDALDDRDPQVVGAAALSVGAIAAGVTADAGQALRERAKVALAAKLAHTDAGTRFDVAYGLAEIGDPGGRAVLAGAVADADRAWDAVEALAMIEAHDELGRALANHQTPAEAQVLAAGKLLAPPLAGRAHRDDARAVLVAAMANRKGHVRALAVEQLREVGGAWARAPLDKLARSGKGADLGDAIAAALLAIASRGEPGAQESP